MLFLEKGFQKKAGINPSVNFENPEQASKITFTHLPVVLWCAVKSSRPSKPRPNPFLTTLFQIYATIHIQKRKWIWSCLQHDGQIRKLDQQ